jgi:AraC-like DNA-binding protein
MLLKDFLPNPAISTYVRCFRIVHFEFDKDAARHLKVYPPKPEEVLHFRLEDNGSIETGHGPIQECRQQATLSGQLASTFKRRFRGDFFFEFQIVFQPGAIFRLTGMPSSEFADLWVDAACVFSGPLNLTLEQLLEVKNYDAMLLVGEKFVGDLVSRARRSFGAVDTAGIQLLNNGGNLSVDWLAKQSCLCPKQFTRKFRERTGVCPKTYARIIRFNKAYNLKNRFPHLDWLRIALECDYFDYQHLAKDYKDFTGLTPNAFHLHESSSPESLLGLTHDIYTTRADSLPNLGK